LRHCNTYVKLNTSWECMFVIVISLRSDQFSIQVWVEWYGDHTFSKLDQCSLKPYEEGLKDHLSKKKKKMSRWIILTNNVVSIKSTSLLYFERKLSTNVFDITHTQIWIYRPVAMVCFLYRRLLRSVSEVRSVMEGLPRQSTQVRGFIMSSLWWCVHDNSTWYGLCAVDWLDQYG